MPAQLSEYWFQKRVKQERRECWSIGVLECWHDDVVKKLNGGENSPPSTTPPISSKTLVSCRQNSQFLVTLFLLGLYP
jgi:hypothetical protein